MHAAVEALLAHGPTDPRPRRRRRRGSGHHHLHRRRRGRTAGRHRLRGRGDDEDARARRGRGRLRHQSTCRSGPARMGDPACLGGGDGARLRSHSQAGGLVNLSFLARQIANVIATTAGHVTDDRVFFGMQLARRLPGPASRAVGRGLGHLPGDAVRAASAWLLGEETKAKRIVAESPSPSRLLGEIALNLGLLDEAEAIALAVPEAAALSSRIRWTKGHIDEAIAVLPEGDRRTRLIDERLCLQPGWWPEAPTCVTARPARCQAVATHPPAALHVLTNSLPHTRSEEHTSELQSRGHLVCRPL